MSRRRPGTPRDPRTCPICGRAWEHDGWRWTLVGPEPEDWHACLTAAVHDADVPTLDDVLATLDLAALTALPPSSQEWWLGRHLGAPFAWHYLETLRDRGHLRSGLPDHLRGPVDQ